MGSMLVSGRVVFRVKRFRSQGLGFKIGPLGWTSRALGD